MTLVDELEFVKYALLSTEELFMDLGRDFMFVCLFSQLNKQISYSWHGYLESH